MKLEQVLILVLSAIVAAMLFLTIVATFMPEGNAVQSLGIWGVLGGGVLGLLGLIVRGRGRDGDRDGDA